MILLRFTGEGEVFYLQSRVGFKGKIFEVFKFATMKKDSPNIGSGTLTMKNDDRILPIGIFLRKYKINEIPQLINIVLGQMSVVGPRPLVKSGEMNFSSSQATLIRSVRPGLTGIGSLYGHRTDASEFYKNKISPYKAELEIWYVKNQSLLLDISIIFLTLFAILFPRLRVEVLFSSIPKPPKDLKN